MAKAISEPVVRTPIDTQMRKYELHSILHEVEEYGFVSIPMVKLLRLLDRGNKSARAWRELLDEWEELGYERDELHAYITPWQGLIVLTRGVSKPINEMAGE
jgi:hypothetical protein